MIAALRTLGSIVAAMATVLVLLIAVELFSSIVHPVPPDFQGTTEEMCQHVANYPASVLAAVVPMWAVTALLGTWIAGRLGNPLSAIIVAILLLAAALLNIVMLPYPLWFKIAQPIAILIAIAVGYRLTSRPQPAADPVAE